MLSDFEWWVFGIRSKRALEYSYYFYYLRSLEEIICSSMKS